MDAKITLSFRADIIQKAKEYAENQGLSLSRLTEILLNRLIKSESKNIEDFRVSDWVMMAADGEAEYISRPKTNKTLRKEFHESKHSS